VAHRLEHQSAADAHAEAVVLDQPEFTTLIQHMATVRLPDDLIDQIADVGFVINLPRNAQTESLFQWLRLPDTATLLFACRDDTLYAMRIAYQQYHQKSSEQAPRTPPYSAQPC
jgi:hypothetical protein